MNNECRVAWYNTMRESVNEHQYYHLVCQLSCVFEDEDGDFEVMFKVPTKYAMKYFDMTFEELENFLDNEYTSEDSEALLAQAHLDGQLLGIW